MLPLRTTTTKMGTFLKVGIVASSKSGRQIARICTITNVSVIRRTFSKQPINFTKLAEVGRFEDPKNDSIYETGQLFLHKIFGYRGVILFPWTARVYDRDRQQQTSETKSKSPIAQNTETADAKETSTTTAINPTTEEATNTETAMNQKSDKKDATEYNKNTKTFYQVLIDSRDCPYIRAQTEAVTFLGNQDSNRNLYAIPGLDYVSHDDIWPYTTNERYPILHELYEKFLQYEPNRDPPFIAKDTLKAWKDKNHPWLELSDVHRETTDNIRITVIPFYMGCRETPASSVYWWRYCIRLENMGPLSVQLRERHWRIFSLSGTLETVRGRGVVGQEPILSRRLPAFQYSSHVSLQAPSGHMWGTFRLEREDGHTFDCKIPPFSLESKPDESIPITPPSQSSTDSATESKKNTKENTDNKTGSKD